ncbi:MAG: DEAD/DEAH box helicase [Rhodospirillales bacterium]|nr:MAG: DEAD/DEAH box helicase [Rhodospirillales bacterium]
MSFAELGLGEKVLRAVTDAGYTEATPIQAQAIPYILMGRDILGCAQTGTGKTASFTLPMIEILSAGHAKARMPRSLILEPTRELAAQVAENFDTYGRHSALTKALIIGGESMADQVRVLARGVDVLIATPGRLLDMFDRGHLVMNDVRVLVIDEADRMLDMGFIPDVERIVSLLSRMRQTLLFSATMPPEIRRLADAFLMNPKEIIVSPPSTPAETVSQGLMIVSDANATEPRTIHRVKRAALRALIGQENVENALIFCNRKRDVGIVQRSLARHGFNADMLHGDMAQSARSEVLSRFKRGDVALLVCSDVAARGLDIAGISHVFNFDVPTAAEDYIHRIGRTGRAGRVGRALTVAMPEDGPYVIAIESLIGKAIPRVTVPGIEGGELMTGKRRGRRGAAAAAPAGRRGEPKPEPRPTRARSPRPPVEPAAAEQREDVPTPRAAERRRGRAGHSVRGDDAPVIGMGDHVPAFLLREPKLVDRES